jgi:hypothetical protein
MRCCRSLITANVSLFVTASALACKGQKTSGRGAKREKGKGRKDWGNSAAAERELERGREREKGRERENKR